MSVAQSLPYTPVQPLRVLLSTVLGVLNITNPNGKIPIEGRLPTFSNVNLNPPIEMINGRRIIVSSGRLIGQKPHNNRVLPFSKDNLIFKFFAII
jgi:hypothetical protein